MRLKTIASVQMVLIRNQTKTENIIDLTGLVIGKCRGLGHNQIEYLITKLAESDNNYEGIRVMV